MACCDPRCSKRAPMSLSTMAAARQKLMKLSATVLTSTMLIFRCCIVGSITTSKSDCSVIAIGHDQHPSPTQKRSTATLLDQPNLMQP